MNLVQSSTIETRINAELAKSMIRGSFATFSGVVNKAQLKTVAQNEQNRLLDKLREILDVFDSGKKAGLVPDKSPKTNTSRQGEPAGTGETGKEMDAAPTGSDANLIELKKRNILKKMEEDKKSMRDLYNKKITAELNEVCSMFDLKAKNEIDESKAELLLNLRQNPENRDDLLVKFRRNVVDIENNAQNGKTKAIEMTIAKYRQEIKNDIETIREVYRKVLNVLL